MIRGVVFDRDETLGYTDGAVFQEAVAWLVAEYGLEPQRTLLALQSQWQAEGALWHTVDSEAAEAAYWERYGLGLTERLGLAPEAAGAIFERFPYQRYMRPYPEAAEVLAALRARGLKIGVLSNSYPSIGLTLEAMGLAQWVDVPLSMCSLGVHKPDVRAFVLAAQAMALAPAEILFVDDKFENVEAARAVGMQACQIDRSGQVAGALRSLQDVLRVIDAD